MATLTDVLNSYINAIDFTDLRWRLTGTTQTNTCTVCFKPHFRIPLDDKRACKCSELDYAYNGHRPTITELCL